MTLPIATVSLLFSDVEGSTALPTRLGDAYRDGLGGQRRILRQAWDDYGGVEMGTEGDSFFVVFSTAPSAVAAAVQAQRSLAAFDWPNGEESAGSASPCTGWAGFATSKPGSAVSCDNPPHFVAART